MQSVRILFIAEEKGPPTTRCLLVRREKIGLTTGIEPLRPKGTAMDVFHYYDTITRRSRHSLSKCSADLYNLTRRNATGYFDSLKASWNSMQQSKICMSIESFSKQRPHATRHTTPWKRMARSKRCLMNSNPPRLMTIMGTEIRGIAQARRAHVASEENEMFRKTEAVMTPQEAEELGVTVETAKQAIRRNAPTTEGGTPEQVN